MIVAVMRMELRIPWARSLKDKRMEIRSAMDKIHDRFRVSIAEVDRQDLHQSAVLGVACVAGSTGMADSVLDHILCFLDNRTELEVVDVTREFV